VAVGEAHDVPSLYITENGAAFRVPKASYA